LDFKKAFDLIDHHLLVEKLRLFDIPKWVLNWIVDFLSGRKQRVKLKYDCFSGRELEPAGVPQGDKVGALAIPDYDQGSLRVLNIHARN
jgi:hypothetical protein